LNFAQYLQDWDLNEGAPQQEIEAVNAHYGERPAVRLPFIGMAPEYADEVADSFENLILELADE